jgi:hypothetical protein
MAYPASLGLRLTQRGAEASNRASEFLFLAVAFVLAVAATECWLKVCDTWKGRYLLGIWATVLFAGGVILGWPSWARLPGPYLVGADMRSIEPQGVAAARWARDNLGPGARVAADRTNRLLIGYYGEQRPITGYGDNVDESPVFFAPELGKFEIDTLQQGQVRYLVVDQRLTSGLPMVGVYFEQGEPNTFVHRTPIDPQALAKFDRAKGVNRIFDSGDISIFDVGALR